MGLWVQGEAVDQGSRSDIGKASDDPREVFSPVNCLPFAVPIYLVVSGLNEAQEPGWNLLYKLWKRHHSPAPSFSGWYDDYYH